MGSGGPGDFSLWADVDITMYQAWSVFDWEIYISIVVRQKVKHQTDIQLLCVQTNNPGIAKIKVNKIFLPELINILIEVD